MLNRTARQDQVLEMMGNKAWVQIYIKIDKNEFYTFAHMQEPILNGFGSLWKSFDKMWWRTNDY